MARSTETIPPPDLASTRRHLEECRRRLDRIARRYGELEEALRTLESLAEECFSAGDFAPAPEQEHDEAGRPRKPR